MLGAESHPSHPAVPTAAEAFEIWRAHQADRAWIEWGFCWPPVSIRRPRCLTCDAAWPCEAAQLAHGLLAAPPAGGPSGGSSGGPAAGSLPGVTGRP